MKSWMTASAGIISILVALWHCYQEGKIDVMCVVTVIQGAGLIVAKDANAHSTLQQVEAETVKEGAKK